MIKELWVKISYWWFIILLFIVGLFCGGLDVKADTVNYNYKQYRVQFYDTSSYATAWTSWTNFNSNTAISSGYGLSTIATRFGYSNKFTTGTQYRFVIEVGFSPSTSIDDIPLTQPTNTTCAGSNSYSSWSNDTSLINQCFYVGATRVRGSNHVKFIFDVITSNDIQGVQFNISFLDNDRYAVNYVNVYNASSIYTGADIGGVIEEQTIIIQNEFEDITNTIIQNNEDLIEAITDSNQEVIEAQKVCKTISVNNSFNNLDKDKKQNSNGSLSAGSSYAVTPFIKINSDTRIKVNKTVNANYYQCFFDSSYTVISCTNLQSSSGNGVGSYMVVPSNAVFVRFNFPYGSSGRENIVIINTCDNGNQSVEDTLTDSSIDDPTSSFEDMQDLLPSNGTITNLIALPITLYQKVLNSINGTCSAYSLGSLYGTNLVLPCIDLADYLGSTIWNTIDIILSGMTVYFIARKMIKAFEGFTSMKDGDVIND